MFMGGNDCLNRKHVCYCFIESLYLIKHFVISSLEGEDVFKDYLYI